MLLWESVFSWLAFLRKHTSGDTILNCLTFSIQLLFAQFILLQGLSFWGGWTYLLFWFCLLLWLCLIFSYPFRVWISFLHAHEQQQKKLFGFLVSFTFFDWVAYDQIFFLKVPFRGLLTLKVIFHALKDKIRVLILRKDITSELGGRLHEKKCGLMRAFGRQGQCRGFGQQTPWKTWGAQMK